MSARERWAEGDQARADAMFGMHVLPDDRAGTPPEWAREAFDRGDQMFAVDLPIAYTQGNTQASVSSLSRTLHGPQSDYLGAIEAEGWRLEHVSTAYVHQGTIGAGNLQTAHHGVLTGYFVFRRRGPA